jgi:long-chain acyl-CoA synthetase
LLKRGIAEFLITDLALASQSIVSFTLSSLSLLTAALVNHAPTAIIVPEQFLEHILEHLKDLRQSAHHFIIVLGDEKGKSAQYSQQSGIRILKWEDIETKGGTVPKQDLAPPG